MSKFNNAEKVWQKMVKLHFPGTIIGSDEYNIRRNLFFMGMWASMVFMQKTPSHAFDEMVRDLHAELESILGPNTRSIKGN